MRKYLIGTVVLLLILLVQPARAIVGFVPNGGLWFSKTDLKPGEAVTVYTVVINSEYALISGAVTFYDNDQSIATVPVKVEKDQAVAVKANWQPKDGQHGVYARLSGSAMQKSDGPTIAMPTTEVHATIASISGTQIDQPLADAVTVEVRTAGSDRTIIPVGSTELVAGEKITASSTAGAKSSTQLSTSSAALTPEQIFAKNRAILDQASNIISSITTTANNAATAYEQSKDFITKSKEYIAQAQGVWQRAQPYIAQAAPVWDSLSNHNDPIRIAIIVVVVLIVLAIIRRL